MQLANQTFYFAIFITFLGLMASFFWGKGSQRDQYRTVYWPIGLILFATSFLSFYLGTWLGLPVLLLANLSLVAGSLCIALLFSVWQNSLTKTKKIVAATVFFVTSSIYIYLLKFGTVVERIYLMNAVLALISGWQLFTLLSIFKKERAYQIPLLILAEIVQLVSRVARSIEVYYYADPALPSLFQEGMMGFALRIASTLATLVVCILITNYYLEKLMQDHQKSAHAIENGLLTSLNALSMARDNETGNHILRTQKYVQILAKQIKKSGFYVDELSDAAIDNMMRAAPLHDVGKVGIPDNILKKNGSLSDGEWEIMKTHASLGAEVLRAAKVEDVGHTKVLDMAIKIAEGHHENWDGTGYPGGLKGVDIPLPARIMALADMYDALVSERVYKKQWSHDEAYAEIVGLSGIRFDPVVVDAFIQERNHFVGVANKYRDET
jgi:response regulator RpfG family c-di-GMP phosphodiesterase